MNMDYNWKNPENQNQYYNIYCTMLHLFDDLWLDKIIPKNNDRRQFSTLYWPVENYIAKNNDRSRLQHCVIYYCIIWPWRCPK